MNQSPGQGDYRYIQLYINNVNRYILDWELTKATLAVQIDQRTVVQGEEEGLLLVTLINKNTGQETRGTVCDDEFNQDAARLFCHYMGYLVTEGVWGSDSSASGDYLSFVSR